MGEFVTSEICKLCKERKKGKTSYGPWWLQNNLNSKTCSNATKCIIPVGVNIVKQSVSKPNATMHMEILSWFSIWQSINIIHHINEIREKSHAIFSIGAGKAPDKFFPIMTQTPSKSENKRNFPDLVARTVFMNENMAIVNKNVVTTRICAN